MVKKKSIIIVVMIILITLIYCIYSPIRIAAEENKEQTSTKDWIDSGFVDPTASEESIGEKKIDSTIYNSKLYVASKISILDGEYAKNKIYIQSYDGQNWENVGEPIISKSKESLTEKIAFCNRNEEGLYIFHAAEGLLEVSKLNMATNTWIEITSLSDVSEKFEISSNGKDTYITAINQNQTVAKIYKFDGINLTEIIAYKENDGYIGEPKVAILNTLVYISVKEAGKETISLYEYDPEANTITEVENCNISAFTYTMAAVSENVKDKLYIAAITTNEEEMIIYTYDGSSWSTIETGLKFEQYTPNLVIKEGDAYILALVADGNLQTYTHNRNNNTFQKEGNDVDTSADMAQAIAYKDNIYTIYITTGNNEIKVRKKLYTRTILRGDIDGNNRISVADANLGARALAKIDQLTDKQLAAGDLNGDGKLSVGELVAISQFLAKIRPEL